MYVPKTACKPALKAVEKGKEAVSCCAPVQQVAGKAKKVIGCC